MPEVLLYRACEPTNPGEFRQTSSYYTGNLTSYLRNGSYVNEELYRVEEIATFTCTSYQIPLDTVVEDRCLPGRGTDTRQARLIGRANAFGLVVFEPLDYNSLACPVQSASCDIVASNPTGTPPTSATANDGIVDVYATSSRPPLAFFLNGTNNTTGAQTGRFTDLPEGLYSGYVQDAAGCQARFGPVDLRINSGLEDLTWLKYDTYEGFLFPSGAGNGLFDVIGSHYDVAARGAVTVNRLQIMLPANFPRSYSRPTTEQIDAYLLADNVTYRQVYHDGNGGLQFVDTVRPPGGSGSTGLPGQLRFANLIRTDVDEAGTATGAVLLEATNDGVGGQITYGYPARNQFNTRGEFANLAAGTHRFHATDASGQRVETDVTIADAYRPRWRLLTEDVTREPVEVVLLERDYAGEEEAVCASGDQPVVRRWEGAGNDPLALIPELVGSSVTVQVLAPDPRPFAVLATGDDRRHRLDVYRSGRLEGRYYVTPDLMRVQVHEALPTISITATDGLAGLRDTLFENHLGERVTTGRWPVLHTLLHALSRTDLNLPLYVNVQLRDVLMSDTTEPVAATTHDREAYAKEGSTPLLHDVVTALLRPYNACLWQARGAWWIASPLDMALAAEEEAAGLWTAYNPAGGMLPAGSAAGLELWAVKNPGELTQARQLEWQAPGAEQATTAAAKVVQVSVKLQLRDNNLPGGELQEWNAAGTLPAFWGEGPALRVVGETAGTYALRLPSGGRVLTPPMQTYPDPDYSPIVLRLKARCRAAKPNAGQPANPAVLVVTVLTEGRPDPQTLRLEVPRAGNEAKMQEYSATLPATSTGTNIRLRLENSSTEPIEIGYVRAQILPALVEWPEEDTLTVTQPDGYLQAPAVQLVHADQPRLTIAPDVLAPAQRMDVLAWKHAFTLLNGRATSLWRRPGARRPAPLLETAGLDALQQRVGEQCTLAGTLLGYAGTGAFSFGQLVVSPDARGVLLWVVSCEVDDADGSAAVVLRPIGTAPAAQLPANARVTTSRAVRVTTDGAVRVYRL